MSHIKLEYTSAEQLAFIVSGVVERQHHYSETGEDIDSSDLVDRDHDEPSEALERLWAEYERALHAALHKFATDVDWAGLRFDLCWADECMQDDGPYNVFMTLNGEGVGIWDGRWDSHFVDGKVGEATLDTLKSFLKRTLKRFADDCGGGSINEALECNTYRVEE